MSEAQGQTTYKFIKNNVKFWEELLHTTGGGANLNFPNTNYGRNDKIGTPTMELIEQ